MLGLMHLVSRAVACSASVVLAGGVLLASAASVRAKGGPLRHLTRTPTDIDLVAYAGKQRLYAIRGALMRRTPDGRSVQVARLRGTAIQLEASSSAVALIEQRGSAQRLLAGAPAGPLRTLARCRGRRPEIPYAPLAVADSTIAEALTCERALGIYNGAASFRVHQGRAVRTVQAPPGERVIALAGASRMLATATQHESLEGPVRVEVSDVRTGTLHYTVPGLPHPHSAEPLAVQADGLAVFCGPGGLLAWASRVTPTAHSIGRVRCPWDVVSLSVAERSVAYHDERTDALHVTDLAGRVRTLIRPSGDIPFDWNGRRLLVRGLGCGDDFLGETALRAVSFRGPTCRVQILGVARGRNRGVVHVTMACRPACRGDLRLSLGNSATESAVLRLRRGGRRTVRIRLRPRARQLLSRYRRVPFHVAVNYVNPSEGAMFQPILTGSGALPGDGARRFPRPPPSPPKD